MVLVEGVQRWATGPDHIVFDAVTWRDPGRILEALERRAGLVGSPRGRGAGCSRSARCPRRRPSTGIPIAAEHLDDYLEGLEEGARRIVIEKGDRRPA